MEKKVLFDLEQNRKRLQYYFQLKERSGPVTPASIDKWIDIYSERMQMLEKQATQLGLRVSFSPRFDRMGSLTS